MDRKCKHYYFHQKGSQVFVIEWCKCGVRMLIYIFKVTNFEIWISRKWWELAKKILKCDFNRSWYLPSYLTIANGVLLNLYLNSQGQTFLWNIFYAFVVKKISQAADVLGKMFLDKHCPAVELLVFMSCFPNWHYFVSFNQCLEVLKFVYLRKQSKWTQVRKLQFLYFILSRCVSLTILENKHT